MARKKTDTPEATPAAVEAAEAKGVSVADVLQQLTDANKRVEVLEAKLAEVTGE